MPCHNVDFVAFNFFAELDGWLPGIYSGTQGLGHILYVILIQVQLPCDLQVRKIQAHQVETQYPDAQWLMVPFKDGSTQIVKVRVAALAVVPLTSLLRFVVSMSSNLIAAAVRAAHAVWPSDLSNSLKAFGIIDKSVDFDEQLITLVLSNHGLSFRGKGAQDKYAKTMKKSRTISPVVNFSATWIPS